MSKEQEKLRDKITVLLNTSNYDATQIIGNEKEEPYEGCVRNLYMILYSSDYDVVIESLDEEHPLCRKGHKTYRMAFDGWVGKSQIIIWDLDEIE